MSDMDFAQASAALSEAAQSDAADIVAQDAAVPAPVEPAPVEPAASPEATPVEPDAATSTEDSFTGVDINSLPEGPVRDYAIQVERRMQADYTRKTQEVAGWRKLGDELGVESPEAVAQQVQMVNMLNSDPAYARAFYENLGAQLQGQGLIQPEQPPQPDFDPYQGVYDDFSGGLEAPVTDPALTNRLGQLEQQLAQQAAWQQQQAEQAWEQQQAATMQRQESAIRQAHPEYKDEDFEAIYTGSLRHGGNLMAAANDYEGMKARILSDYIATKQTVQDTTPVTSVGGVAADVPVGFGTDLEAAHKAAIAALQGHLGQDG